jgi:hypothetical protein
MDEKLETNVEHNFIRFDWALSAQYIMLILCSFLTTTA